MNVARTLPTTLLIPVILVVVISHGSQAWAQPSPQVTSELTCSKDADCPAHDFPCSIASWFPGCGCDEGKGRCDPNPKACRSQLDCFGQEICSRDGHCVEPGGSPSGALCNTDQDCVPWLRCLNGGCNAVNCAVDRDCAQGLVCENTICRTPRCQDNRDCLTGTVCRHPPGVATSHCVPAACQTDGDCRSREVCRDAACVAVECRVSSDCGGCRVCEVGNRCVDLCQSDERCASFAVLTPGGLRPLTVVSRCVDRSALACQNDALCPLGEQCLGGHCLRLPEILEGLGRSSAPSLR